MRQVFILNSKEYLDQRRYSVPMSLHQFRSLEIVSLFDGELAQDFREKSSHTLEKMPKFLVFDCL